MLTPVLKRAALLDFFISAPFLSVKSYSHVRSTNSAKLLFKAGLFSLLLYISILLSNSFLAPLSYWDILLISPSIYFLTESMGAMGQLIFALSGKSSFPIHRHPFLATSLSDFWGRRWNLWVQDWLRDISRFTKRFHLGQRLFVTFFFSGLFHELMLNLPYWISFRRCYFGTMMIYFFIQGWGLWMEKKLFKKAHPLFQKVYLWAVVILPCPLFINPPLLTFLGFQNG